MSSERPASFVNAVVTGVVTSLAFSLGSPQGVSQFRVNYIAGDNVVGNSVRAVADKYHKLIGQGDAGSTTNTLPTSFIGFLSGFVGAYVIDKVWLMVTGKAPENQSSNFTSFVQTAAISAVIAPAVVPAVMLRMPPFNPDGPTGVGKLGMRYALLFAGSKLVSQGLYQQLILEEALGQG